MLSSPVVLKRLFSSGLRVKLLSHYFLHPGERFHIRGLASALSESAGNVARELANLEKAGLVVSAAVGNQKHYAIDTHHPAIDGLRSILIKTVAVGDQVRAILKPFKDIELAFIYGSFASGEAGPESDIDLMIIGNVSEHELVPVLRTLEKNLSRDVNCTIYSRREVAKRIGIEGDFVHEVFAGPKSLLVGSPDDGLFKAS